MAARKNSRNKAKKTSLPWGIILLSFSLGSFVTFLLHLEKNIPADAVKENNANSNTVTKKKIEPKFDFYTLLPEVEVVVHSDKEQAKSVVTLPPQKNEKKKTKKERYIVQVGSFRKASDAESYKARLALLGVQSKIQTVTIDDQETWHRVQVGPIEGREQADRLQNQLKQSKIKSLLMKAKKG